MYLLVIINVSFFIISLILFYRYRKITKKIDDLWQSILEDSDLIQEKLEKLRTDTHALFHLIESLLIYAQRKDLPAQSSDQSLDDDEFLLGDIIP